MQQHAADMKAMVADRFSSEFGPPVRDVKKVKSWDLARRVGAVLQVDGLTTENAALVWLPYPPDGQSVPEAALEYPGEAGRHSGTYPAAGLRRGEPALRVTLRGADELDGIVAYLKAMAASQDLPIVPTRSPGPAMPASETGDGSYIDPTTMPAPKPSKPRREAIPRLVQREVWQRDEGRCVECGTREKLCFDHIVPFSRGGSNTVRNLQLLCETCNSRKGNRL
jgi:hypothetical protein